MNVYQCPLVSLVCRGELVLQNDLGIPYMHLTEHVSLNRNTESLCIREVRKDKTFHLARLGRCPNLIHKYRLLDHRALPVMLALPVHVHLFLAFSWRGAQKSLYSERESGRCALSRVLATRVVAGTAPEEVEGSYCWALFSALLGCSLSFGRAPGHLRVGGPRLLRLRLRLRRLRRCAT